MSVTLLPPNLRNKIAITPSGCWTWRGEIDRHGYGRAQNGRRRPLAHRVVFAALAGPIPDGLTIDHLCRVRHCVNPQHLEPVTVRTNTLRGEGVTAQNARKTHCAQGHPYDEANTCYLKTGARRCRECHRAADRLRAPRRRKPRPL